MFRETDKEADDVLDYGTLRELADHGLVDFVFGSGTKSGYLFQATYSATTPEFLFMAIANPAIPTTTGDRYFASNNEGVVFYTSAAPFTLNPDCTIPLGARVVGK